MAGERLELKSRTTDERRYDLVRDVVRVERSVADRSDANGAVVVLASDPALWGSPRPGFERSADAAFRVHDGVVLQGSLGWGPTAGPGTVGGRDARLDLQGQYAVAWMPFADEPIDLRALVIPITQ